VGLIHILRTTTSFSALILLVGSFDPYKPVPDMTYNVFSGTLNPTQSINQALNDLIARVFSSAGLPVTKEPSGLFRSDGKRPDGLTLVPWPSGKALCLDVTVTCPLAESYISAAARESGAAAEIAASR